MTTIVNRRHVLKAGSALAAASTLPAACVIGKAERGAAGIRVVA